MQAVQTVSSVDGTQIAFERAGSGPHLVLVHGTSASRQRWGNIRKLLEPHFTVTLVDRRGRGDSGDTAPYSLEREYEDVAAAVDACDAPVLLFGHSYGGLCALGAMRLTANVAALAIYEAPVFEGSGASLSGIERLEALLAAGDREGVITVFARDIVRMPPSDLERLRNSPAWPARLAAAHTLPRELRAADTFRLAEAAPERITQPTLLLHGGDSPDYFVAAMKKLADALPGARTSILAGQQHVAMDSAPQLLAAEITAFWSEAARRS